MKLILENVRCFRGEHAAAVKPITLLLGENSAGKTTFMATLATVRDFAFPGLPDFNRAPFRLGGFENIATFGSPEFSIGLLDELHPGKKYVATYFNDHNQIRLQCYSVESQHAKATLKWDSKDRTYYVTGETRTSSGTIRNLHVPLQTFPDVARSRMGLDLYFYIQHALRTKEKSTDKSNKILELFSTPIFEQIVVVAPIRSKPQRTYDQVSEPPSPEGEHIPYVLFQELSAEKGAERKVLQEQLLEFGIESHLYQRLGVRKLGRLAGDPFQLMIKASSKPVSLLDVGYGVSQALPVVVQTLLADRNTSILMQQPEVHLHPRGQAALGSLFVNQWVKHKKKFVIETHSDYIVDRIRIEILNGAISPKDIGILFFERRQSSTTIHEIKFDNQANVLGAPEGYREFFLREQLSLLGATS